MQNYPAAPREIFASHWRAIHWLYNVKLALSAKDQQGKALAAAEHFA